MNTTISDKEYDAAIAAANKAATDPYVYVHKLIQPFEYEGKKYDTLTFDFGRDVRSAPAGCRAEHECGLSDSDGLPGVYAAHRR